MRQFIGLLMFLFLIHPIQAQIHVSGKIEDPYGHAVSYATISASDKQTGAVSQIDGTFELTLPHPDSLHVFYLGLEPYSFYADKSKKYYIRLRSKSYQLEEVVVFPGINPADTIMQNVIGHRDQHDPKKLPDFSYTAYNKFHIEINRDTLAYFRARGITNPNLNMLYKMSDQSNIFLTEAISDLYYKSPGKKRENILTTNISGFRNPAFAMLGSQLQSLSCYDDFFSIGSLKYVNPVSSNATKKYLFLLKDTLQPNTQKETFVITFRPKPGTSFNAMYGMLFINADDYAIRRIVAQPVSQPRQIGITVRQEYQKLNGRQWFPHRLQSRISFNDKVIDSLPPFPIMIGYASTDIIDPEIGTGIPKKILRRQFEINYAKNAGTTDDTLFARYRTDSLTEKDLSAFRLMDTLKSEFRILSWMEALPQLLVGGEIPLGYFNLNLQESIGYNLQEKWRLGLSLMTSQRLLKWMRFGGKMLRSQKPGDWRYAARVHINPLNSGVLRLKYQYEDETSEKGAYHFYDPYRIGFYNLREFVFPALNYVKGHQAALEIEYPRFVNFRFRTNIEDYYLSHTATDTNFGDFRRNSLGVDFRYAPGEKLTNMGKYRFRESAGGPLFNFSFEQGFNFEKQGIEYQRVLGKITYNYVSRFGGTFRVMGKGGWTKGDIPLEMALNGKGSAGLHLYEPGVFQTMPVYRFFHTRFVNGFLQHYLPIHLYSRNLKLSVASQLGVLFGDSHGSRISSIARQATKGYYEAGLLGGMMSPEFGKIELGVFYRMGEYTQPALINNLSLVLSLTTQMDW